MFLQNCVGQTSLSLPPKAMFCKHTQVHPGGGRHAWQQHRGKTQCSTPSTDRFFSEPISSPWFTKYIPERSHIHQGDLGDSRPDAGPVPGDVDVLPRSLQGQCSTQVLSLWASDCSKLLVLAELAKGGPCLGRVPSSPGPGVQAKTRLYLKPQPCSALSPSLLFFPPFPVSFP